MMDRETLLESIPAYALGALEEAERQEVEALLASDAEARERLAEYEAIAEVLVMSAPLREAPAHLKDTLRQRITTKRPDNVTALPSQAEIPQRQTPQRIWIMAIAAVATLFVVAGLVGVLMLQDVQPSGQQLWAQLSQEDGTQRFPIDSSEFEGVSGELLVSADGADAVLRVANFPEIAEDQIFQFWLNTEDEVHSGGLWLPKVDRSEFFIVLDLERPLQELVRIGCSVEPAGGSESPTGPRVFSIPLQQEA
ncbi:MAG: anti-sigma factor [Anaerolineae bacterium]|nr:anti-sigma factor [Anaerolineae bacterium]